MDGVENCPMFVRCEIRRKGSIECGVIKLPECVNSIQVCALHIYSTALVRRFYDNMPATS